jgi:hypothetical protein
MAYRRVRSLECLQEELRKVSGSGARETNRMKAALVAAFAVRASRLPEVAADLRAHLRRRPLETRSNWSQSRSLVLATLAGLSESNYTRLAQLCDRAIRSNLHSREVYYTIVDEGLNAFTRRNLPRPR